MRPETEAKIMIALLISLIAFGCGSCLGIILGISPTDTTLNITPNNAIPTPTAGITNQTQTEKAGPPSYQKNTNY